MGFIRQCSGWFGSELVGANVVQVIYETADSPCGSRKNPASNGREMIDDFRLRGSRTWRRMGGPLTRGGWRTEVAHVVAYDFDNYKPALSEGEALAVVVQAVPGNPHWTWVGTDSPNPLRQSVVRRRLALSPPRTARRGATREGEEVEGAPPPF